LPMCPQCDAYTVYVIRVLNTLHIRNSSNNSLVLMRIQRVTHTVPCSTSTTGRRASSTRQATSAKRHKLAACSLDTVIFLSVGSSNLTEGRLYSLSGDDSSMLALILLRRFAWCFPDISMHVFSSDADLRLKLQIYDPTPECNVWSVSGTTRSKQFVR
jgi:hypothetical protein